MSEYPIGSTAKKYYLQDGSEVTLRHLIAKEPEWARSRIIEGEHAAAKLATIERDTAEKCAKLSENIVGNGCDFIEDIIAEGIRDHFNHKEG